ncbi:hypothetical protein ENSA5_21350 [Enhygromyxa salina]|uniref:Uncharacterized protein n=1 Tax=Enhygromyxa salina TaxID=215803 RepID=A0A2S9YCK4_9BACT|nr:hypothetical protein [Enhygromyxa salina]PRQ02782.1 hypothetical protein ENSA5_21350 [Enhygromyxa salina]
MENEAVSVDRGATQLRRLETLLDVAYAVLFVNFIMYLPETEDMAWTELPLGLLSVLIDDHVGLMRVVIGVGLTLISWNLTHKLLGPLERTDAWHTLLALLQLIFVCLFLWFAIADPELVSVSSRAGQSLCLAVSGFIGSAGWGYARKRELTPAGMSEAEKDEVLENAIIEPTTALLNTGLAFIGPEVWTAGWFVIPVVLISVQKRVARRG